MSGYRNSMQDITNSEARL